MRRIWTGYVRKCSKMQQNASKTHQKHIKNTSKSIKKEENTLKWHIIVFWCFLMCFRCVFGVFLIDFDAFWCFLMLFDVFLMYFWCILLHFGVSWCIRKLFVSDRASYLKVVRVDSRGPLFFWYLSSSISMSLAVCKSDFCKKKYFFEIFFLVLYHVVLCLWVR